MTRLTCEILILLASPNFGKPRSNNAALESEIRRHASIRQWLKRILGGFIGLVILLLLAGAILQAVAEHRDRLRFPRPGELVDVGGFRLNLICSGEGSPTVVLDSGLGVPAVGWMPVQTEIAKFTRVCSYDRAGYGWSEPGPLPRTSLEVAAELHILLQRARIPPPYILVGHSFGGYNVRVYHRQYPGEVVGIVLVDASHEDQQSRMPPSLQEAQRREIRQLRRMRPVMPFMIRLGIARAVAYAHLEPAGLPANLLDEITYLRLQTKYVDAVLSEEESLMESAAEVRGSGTLDDLPLTVLSSGKSTLSPGESDPDFEAFHKIWMEELQPSLARLSTHGRLVIVDKSDHLIPFEQPRAVSDAVREIVLAIRPK